jgi:hypothetical protein
MRREALRKRCAYVLVLSTYRHEVCSGDFRLSQIRVCMHGNGNHPKYDKDTHLIIRQEDGRFGLYSWLYASCSGCKVLY